MAGEKHWAARIATVRRTYERDELVGIVAREKIAQGLAPLGWSEGRNVRIDTRQGGSQYISVRPSPTAMTMVTTGRIIEGWFSVEGGVLVLEDCDRARIASLPLRAGEDALAAARKLLRERSGTDFNRPIVYPKLGIA